MPKRPSHLGNPGLPDSLDESSSTAPADANTLLLRRVLDLLRPEFTAQTWQAFWAVVVDGRPAADVAAELGLSANAVRIAKSRVLSRLRDELNELLDPDGPRPAAP
jgi:RNA polymerase sigma-70 factor (ECF subfamily)